MCTLRGPCLLPMQSFLYLLQPDMGSQAFHMPYFSSRQSCTTSFRQMAAASRVSPCTDYSGPGL